MGEVRLTFLPREVTANMCKVVGCLVALFEATPLPLSHVCGTSGTEHAKMERLIPRVVRVIPMVERASVDQFSLTSLQ